MRRILLESYRFGPFDPTIAITTDSFWRSTWTPQGPATLQILEPLGAARSFFYGQGAQWLEHRCDDLLGVHDNFTSLVTHHDPIAKAQRHFGKLRLGRSLNPYHEIMPAILGQRVTTREAAQQWQALVRNHGTTAPGPLEQLRTPPPPEALAGLPYTTLHTYGIDKKRADTLRHVGRLSHYLLKEWSVHEDPSHHTQSLQAIPGVGPWTAAVAGAVAFGDADALAVGDFHLKNLVAWALHGRARGTDDEMVSTLQPYVGNRHRVVRWLQLAGHRPPARGPHRPIVSITQL